MDGPPIKIDRFSSSQPVLPHSWALLIPLVQNSMLLYSVVLMFTELFWVWHWLSFLLISKNLPPQMYRFSSLLVTEIWQLFCLKFIFLIFPYVYWPQPSRPHLTKCGLEEHSVASFYFDLFIYSVNIWVPTLCESCFLNTWTLVEFWIKYPNFFQIRVDAKGHLIPRSWFLNIISH